MLFLTEWPSLSVSRLNLLGSCCISLEVEYLSTNDWELDFYEYFSEIDDFITDDFSYCSESDFFSK